jgi:Sulfotransferase family
MIPILLCVQGRSGSTAMMKLLASSDAVFCDRDYPFEKRYLTYFAKLAELLGRHQPPDPFNEAAMFLWEDNAFGGFPWIYSAAYESSPWPPDRVDWLRVFWQGFTRLAQRTNPKARYYIEKSPGWLPGMMRQACPAESFYVFRDLRDVYVSSRKWGRTDAHYNEMERSGRTGELAQMISFEFVENYEHYLDDRAAGDAFLVRYEDSIRDPEGTVARVEGRYGLHLSLERSRRDLNRHMTAASLENSVERWRREGIDESAHRAFLHCVGRELRDLGYDVGELSNPPLELRFSRQAMPGASFEESSDGRLHMEDGRARIEVVDKQYWFLLPMDKFGGTLDADSMNHVWACVAEGAGNVCSIFWRAPGQQFSLDNAYHVEYWPAPQWRMVDFPVHKHPNWQGRIAEVRIHFFNLYPQGFGRTLAWPNATCRGTGYLKWLRFLKIE